MKQAESVVAVFDDHEGAEAAVRQLGEAGFDVTQISVVGKGYHLDEKVVGFYNQGDRIRFWGTRGAFWGGLWSLFFGGLFITVPLAGSVIVLGYIAAAALAAVEGAVVVGGASVLAAALYGLGIPHNSVLEYETAIHADRFLVMVHGTPEQIARAGKILHAASAAKVAIHRDDALAANDTGRVAAQG